MPCRTCSTLSGVTPVARARAVTTEPSNTPAAAVASASAESAVKVPVTSDLQGGGSWDTGTRRTWRAKLALGRRISKEQQKTEIAE